MTRTIKDAATSPQAKERGEFIDYFSTQRPFLGVGSALGKKMRRRIFDYFVESVQPTAEMQVMDLGPTPYMSEADKHLAPGQAPDTNYFEFYYPHRSQITAVSIEDLSPLQQVFPGLKTRRIAPGPLPFKDNEFDVLFCSAVLEHVGDRDAQRAFVSECVRVAKVFFITTPNRWFPVDAHTVLPVLHWLPQRWHQAALRVLKREFWADINNLNLLSSRETRALFPTHCTVQVKNFYLFGFPQNIIVWGKKTKA